MRQPLGLINVLIDASADLSSRDDAAMDLSQYPCEDSVSALLMVARSKTESDILVASCGESLGEICKKLGKIDIVQSSDLHPIALSEFNSILSCTKNNS
ncbi:hypothetical protein [Vibrio sp. CUB2]|uniref:hypothetical protein n=1 Tax=Vibrio sp. CUB2 TaxID=2315233 RepID=UPI000AD070E2|nr:hypothetical protein [Vibrio sp. CUB2]